MQRCTFWWDKRTHVSICFFGCRAVAYAQFFAMPAVLRLPATQPGGTQPKPSTHHAASRLATASALPSNDACLLHAHLVIRLAAGLATRMTKFSRQKSSARFRQNDETKVSVERDYGRVGYVGGRRSEPEETMRQSVHSVCFDATSHLQRALSLDVSRAHSPRWDSWVAVAKNKLYEGALEL